jgi:hypothetical protein
MSGMQGQEATNDNLPYSTGTGAFRVTFYGFLVFGNAYGIDIPTVSRMRSAYVNRRVLNE